MRITISLSEAVVGRIDAARAPLDLTRSEFVTEAVARLLAGLDTDATTAKIDEVLAHIGGDRTDVNDAVAAGRALLVQTYDDW